MKPYYVLQNELIFHDGVILRKQKLVVSHFLRRSVLRSTHEGHVSILKCKGTCAARFGGHILISSFISECHSYQTTLDHHQPAPMMPIAMPKSPWLVWGSGCRFMLYEVHFQQEKVLVDFANPSGLLF